MRNIFDQYTQPENRLTHALACTLNADRSLIKPFLRWAGAREVPPINTLRITEQQVPGRMTPGEELESLGLPDACIFSEDGWAFLIESKVQAGISSPQLDRHVATARRYGFDTPYLLLLSVDAPPSRLPKRTSYRAWRDLYGWFRQRINSSSWSQTFVEYLEEFEARMIAHNYGIRGTITMFDGLRFDADKPYSYGEAKRLVRLLGDELQKREDLQTIGVDPHGDRRSAITGSAGTQVWDFLPLKAANTDMNFTAFPHLTMDVGYEEATAAVTVPNGVRGGFRTKLTQVGEEGFFEVLSEIERRIRPVLHESINSRATAYAIQRHFRSQRSVGQVDARLEIDLRTIIPGKRREAKHQPEWARAMYQVMTRKRSNIQLGLVVHFSYLCPVVRSRKAVELFAKSWIAMSPIIDFVLDD